MNVSLCNILTIGGVTILKVVGKIGARTGFYLNSKILLFQPEDSTYSTSCSVYNLICATALKKNRLGLHLREYHQLRGSEYTITRLYEYFDIKTVDISSGVECGKRSKGGMRF